MATYRIYPDRNAWLADNAGHDFATLAQAKSEAESRGWTHVQVINAWGDGKTWYLVNGVWRAA